MNVCVYTHVCNSMCVCSANVWVLNSFNLCILNCEMSTRSQNQNIKSDSSEWAIHVYYDKSTLLTFVSAIGMLWLKFNKKMSKTIWARTATSSWPISLIAFVLISSGITMFRRLCTARTRASYRLQHTVHCTIENHQHNNNIYTVSYPYIGSLYVYEQRSTE